MRQLEMSAAPGTSWKAADSISALPTGLLAGLVAIVCYYAVEIVSILPRHIAPFWPATPFLVAVLLLAPGRIWPLLIAAGLGAQAIADFRNGIPIASEIWYSLGNLAAVLIATWGIDRLFKGMPHLRSVNALVTYLAVAVILAPCVSALVGANGRSYVADSWLEWRIWFFGEALGFLTVTPAILSWAHEGRAWARDFRNYLELAALLAWLVVFGYLTFMRTGWGNSPALLYSLVPPLLWAALRLGLKGVSTSMLLVTFLSVWGAAHDRGPFTGQGPLHNALSLQLFLFFAAIPFLFLAVLVGEQKQAERDRIRMLEEIAHLNRVASMGQMAASLAHELAQPLASILSNAQAATRFANRFQPDLEEIRGALAEITADDQRARAFVQNMRAMFQRHTIAHAQVDLNRIVDDVSRLVRNEALRRGVQIRVVPFPDAIFVLADAVALQQVILNMVNNGMDALAQLPCQSKVLTLTTQVQMDSSFGTILVEDNGCGVAKENRERLFTPFFTTKSDGLGMGLSICRSLIKSLGGRITLVDRSEPGTVFQVQLPLAAQQSLVTSAST
jgi:signal transduction histidine kinase